MMNLMKSELYKVKKERYLLITILGLLGTLCLVMFGFSNDIIVIGIKNVLGTNIVDLSSGSNILVEILKSADVLVLFFLPIIISVFMMDFSVGTIKNNIISGFSRTKIYISKLIISSVICLFLVLIYTILAFLLSILKNGYDGNLTFTLILEVGKVILIQLPLYISTITMAFMIGVLTQRKSVVITIYLLYQVIVLMFLAIIKKLPINIIKYEPISNLDKAAYIGTNTFNDNLTFILIGISIMVITTTIGIINFNRMDIK